MSYHKYRPLFCPNPACSNQRRTIPQTTIQPNHCLVLCCCSFQIQLCHFIILLCSPLYLSFPSPHVPDSYVCDIPWCGVYIFPRASRFVHGTIYYVPWRIRGSIQLVQPNYCARSLPGTRFYR